MYPLIFGHPEIFFVHPFYWQKGQLRIFLLSLPEIGKHTGTNIAHRVTSIVNEFGIADRLGYFIPDNVENNDTVIAALADEFRFER